MRKDGENMGKQQKYMPYPAFRISGFDEIGTEEELRRVSESFCAGVTVITTAHIGCIDDLTRRKVTAALINSEAISKVALLPAVHGGTIKIIRTEELCRGVAV